MIHREGYATIAVTVILIAVLNLVIHFFLPVDAVRWGAYALSAFLLVMVLQFFRDPRRKVVQNEKQVLSPADGTIVAIEEVYEPEYFRDTRIQVSIFMSPVNVHVNRYPVGGVVAYAKYHPGLYLVAWHPKSSAENERTTIVVENRSRQQVLFRQIAGALARRIVFYCKEGQKAEQGAECGFIKFGSRVDVLLPVSASVKVKLRDKTRGGESVIAELN